MLLLSVIVLDNKHSAVLAAVTAVIVGCCGHLLQTHVCLLPVLSLAAAAPATSATATTPAAASAAAHTSTIAAAAAAAAAAA